MKLPSFSYKFDSGPLKQRYLSQNPTEGNCRFAVQYYFFFIRNIYLRPSEVLCPYFYKRTGKFSWKRSDLAVRFDKSLLKPHMIIFAERLKNSKNENVHKTISYYESKDDWIISLHSAIYLGNNKIWHATSIDSGSCIWDLEKFLDYYNPVALKKLD